MNNKAVLIIVPILIIVISGGALFLGYLWGKDWQFNDNPTQITPTLDGIIGEREWKGASYKHPFYLDVDNSLDPIENKRNVDGWNYLYVGEDANYYYIALDLCSDRTNNVNGEWISFFLANQLPEFYSSNLVLHSLIDHGFEYLFYNVSDDAVMPNEHFNGFGFINHNYIPIVPGPDQMIPIIGNSSSYYQDFWRKNDGKNYTMESVHTHPEGSWLEGQFLDLQFGINLTTKMPIMDAANYMASIYNMDLQISLTSNLTSDPINHISNAGEFFCCIAEQGSNPGNFTESNAFLANMHFMPFFANNFDSNNIGLNHTSINATTGMYYFTIHCWNEINATYPTAFEVYIDSMTLKVGTIDYGTTIGTTILPTNQDLAWAYSSSVNCAEEHRMFEFKIAKAEFPIVANDQLYISVAGYGTMSIIGTNYWQYPVYSFLTNPIFNFINDDKDFLVFDMSIT